jgi:hypothetical protein
MNENEIFYTFSDNSFYTRRFPWAMSIYPQSKMINIECPKCEVVEKYPSGEFDMLLEGGGKYPDVLGCGAYPFLILSDKVIDAVREANITCFHTYKVGIKELKSRSKNIYLETPPQYYRVEIDGACQVDLEKSGIKVISYCPECHYLNTRPFVPEGYKMVSGSWDGSDLFRDPVLYPRVSFCTKKLMDIAHHYKFTNFRFEYMESKKNTPKKGLDY